jgi:dienelactone hydrolase
MNAIDPVSSRRKLLGLLGDLPPRTAGVTAELVRREQRPAYELEVLSLDLNGIERVPAFFVRPHNAPGRLPVVLYQHAHGGDYALGKRELLDGRNAIQAPPYAEALTKLGFAMLCCDTWAFGERATRTESAIFKEMLWRGRVMWGMMVFDSLRAMDYLTTRPDVDASRIATMGLSMGSTMSWWLAALDERVKVCVDICCLTDYDALIAAGGLDLHGIYYYVPSLLKHFSAGDINALIAPRPHLSLVGQHDPLTPADGVDRIDRQVQAAYARAGAADAWVLRRVECAHEETPDMRAGVLRFLHERL